ncbi:MAG: MoaD/ThiS family protein [Chthoniobacterales bacterium]|nr:MoaD/ThiS family protein [Chthoniobacterales bacterium]
MIRVILPAHLRTLANVRDEVRFEVAAPVTQSSLLDALENAYPVLRGTIREQGTRRRRTLVRFFANGEDVSHLAPEIPVADEVARGLEPFVIIGAMAGG